MDMKAFLEEKGFYMFHSCNCGGGRMEKYKSDKVQQLLIKIKPNRGTFEIVQFNSVMSRGHSASLEHELNRFI